MINISIYFLLISIVKRMIHQVFLIDHSGVPIHMTTIGKEIIKSEEFGLYSGLITALFTFSEHIAGTPEIIDLKDKYMVIYLLNVNKQQVFIVAIASKTDSRESVEKIIKIISEKIKPILSQTVFMTGLISLNEKIRKQLDEIITKSVEQTRRKLSSFRYGGFKTIAFSTSITTPLSFYFSAFEYLIFFALLHISEKMFLMLYAWIWALFTGILAGYIAGKPKEGAISGYIAIAISYLVAGILSPQFFFTIILSGILTWWPTTAMIGYIIGELYDHAKLT